MPTFIGSLIDQTGIVQKLEFEAGNEAEAYKIGNDGIDPVSGQWVEVRRKPVPQKEMDLPPSESLIK